MLLLISIIISLILVYFCSDFIRKHAGLIYIINIVIFLIVLYFSWNHTFRSFDPFIKKYIWGLFSRAALATGMFVVIMYGAVLPRGKLKKNIMLIRGELSIIASILTLAHNIIFGQFYFYRLFSSPEKLSKSSFIASIISVILITIMLPLFITSFKSVRKKMKAKNWKKLQKLAYIFYFLVYSHVIILIAPFSIKNRSGAFLTVIIYSIVFCSYFGLRIRKAIYNKNKKLAFIPLIVAFIGCISIIIYSIPKHIIVEKNFELGHKINKDSTNAEIEKENKIYTYNNGKFIGIGDGYVSTIKIEVIIKGNKISSLEVLEHEEDEPYFSDAKKAIFADVLSTQNSKVDTVSGATITSEGLIYAIKKALEKSKK